MDNKNILETRKQVTLLWPLENELSAVYANHASIAVSDSEVTLVFGSFLPTGMHGRDEEEVNEAKYRQPAGVTMVANLGLIQGG